jgi:energy-coupling factor transporter ATP-binding protein EcfA2
MFPRLRERRTSRATDLSGCEQQMLAIARALVRDPKILLLDEPFAGLAPIIVRDLLAACRTLAEAGQTILVVEQNISAAMTLADRIYVLNNAHMVEERRRRPCARNPRCCTGTWECEGATFLCPCEASLPTSTILTRNWLACALRNNRVAHRAGVSAVIRTGEQQC